MTSSYLVQTFTHCFQLLKALALFCSKWVVKLKFGENPIYHNVKPEKEQIYQTCFLKIIDSVDLVNLTNQALNRPFNKESAGRDSKVIEQFANRAKAQDGLSPVIIRVMVMQYLYADPLLREKDKSHWIQKVMARDDSAYFPDALSIYYTLYGA